MKIRACLGFLLLVILIFRPAMGQQTAENWYNKDYDFTFQEKYDEAIKDADEAIRVNPNYAEAWGLRGNVFAA